MWFNAHGSSKILPLRDNADFIFIYTISNGKLLEILFEEFFSMTSDDKNAFKVFRKQYRDHIKSEEFNSFMISVRNSDTDWTTKKWNVFNE